MLGLRVRVGVRVFVKYLPVLDVPLHTHTGSDRERESDW